MENPRHSSINEKILIFIKALLQSTPTRLHYLRDNRIRLQS